MRGGFHQAKKWVKPSGGGGGQGAADAQPGGQGDGEGGAPAAAPEAQGAWRGKSPPIQRKWVKPGSEEDQQPAAQPAPAHPSPARISHAGRGRGGLQGGAAAAAGRGRGAGGPGGAPTLSFTVGNLARSVTEMNLGKLFAHAGHVASIRVMPLVEGREHALAFVNFADGTPPDTCRDMCKALDGSKPSWNLGTEISVREQGTEKAAKKPKETHEQRQERFAKLREQFPFLENGDPRAIVVAWGRREERGTFESQLSRERKLELMFGSHVPDAAPAKRDRGTDSDSSDEDDSGAPRRARKRVRTEEEDVEVSLSDVDEAQEGVTYQSDGDDDDLEMRAERERTDDCRAGRGILSKMGYTPGERGLGRERQGGVEVVQLKGNIGRRGLGLEWRPRMAGIPRAARR